MIDVQTSRPVYSNARGTRVKKTADEKTATRQARLEKAKGLYGKAKESGLLQSLENLALQSGVGSGSGGNFSDMPPPPPPPPSNRISTTTWILIGAGVLTVGLGVYFLVIKKK
jgi:hypothetical protein